MMVTAIEYINWFILFYFTCLATGFTFLLLLTFPEVFKKFREARYGSLLNIINQQATLPITIIMPAFNEKNRIDNAVLSVLGNNYKNVHLIVVNDGSTDDTLLRLIQKFELYEVPPIMRHPIKTARVLHYYQSRLYPNFVVIDKEHHSGADCENVGLNACRTPLFATVDADTILEPDALTHIIFTFLTKPHCICVGGSVYVLNGNKFKAGKILDVRISPNPIVGIQACEYLRSFLFGRSGWNPLGGSLSYAGAFTALETQAVIQAGGYDAGNFSQDVEIVVKMHNYMRKHQYPYTIHFNPSAFAWTEVPKTLSHYWRQRDAWQRGTLLSLMSYKHLFFNPRFGIVGLFTYPFFCIFELFAPLVEFTAYFTLFVAWFFHLVNWQTVIMFILLAWGFMAFLTLATIFLSLITYNKYKKGFDILYMFILTILEAFPFRQYGVICKVYGTVHYYVNRFLGKKL